MKLADLELGVTNKSEDSNLKQSGSVGRKSTFMGSVVKEEHPFSIDRDNNNYVEVDDLLVNWLAPEVNCKQSYLYYLFQLDNISNHTLGVGGANVLSSI